ncbi:hypothetical protein TREMEDRAFT_58279 [Tremella mesenterica DSM 1558]|uniref:uncharacterized protein n=1 Tax=Tremella mesenterica (strain ATCC 24925 / CBS 8224 / DSM 1558 / NBRC 9311 / NRRL Y-6157 / RJB 2259-6 / UBC 559-6) TaxID=578456 RepID=UPI0003F48F77|nr:uncharacterized protein TREMEDRAFT_58279 [Tremella mesenterica DSM 1558]EIW72123.1 hypothetical protein TREMEDRAFT_58279 [Tremella mesenterica DSM 1558]
MDPVYDPSNMTADLHNDALLEGISPAALFLGSPQPNVWGIMEDTLMFDEFAYDSQNPFTQDYNLPSPFPSGRPTNLDTPLYVSPESLRMSKDFGASQEDENYLQWDSAVTGKVYEEDDEMTWMIGQASFNREEEMYYGSDSSERTHTPEHVPVSFEAQADQAQTIPTILVEEDEETPPPVSRTSWEGGTVVGIAERVKRYRENSLTATREQAYEDDLSDCSFVYESTSSEDPYLQVTKSPKSQTKRATKSSAQTSNSSTKDTHIKKPSRGRQKSTEGSVKKRIRMSVTNPKEWTTVHSSMRQSKSVKRNGHPELAPLFCLIDDQPAPHLDSFYALSRSMGDHLRNWVTDNVEVNVDRRRLTRECLTSTVMAKWYTQELNLAYSEDPQSLGTMSGKPIDEVLEELEGKGRFTWDSLESQLVSAASNGGTYAGFEVSLKPGKS